MVVQFATLRYEFGAIQMRHNFIVGKSDDDEVRAMMLRKAGLASD